MTALRPVNPPPEPEPETPHPSPAIAADAQAIREWLFSPVNDADARLGVMLSRASGVPETSRLGAVLVGVGAGAIRFLLPLLGGLLAGELGQSPVGSWALIAGLLGTVQVAASLHSQNAEIQSGIFGLVDTLEHEGDAHDLLDFTRRRWRVTITTVFGAAVSVISLVAIAIAAPAAFDALPVGSTVLLGILAFSLGELAYLYVSFMPGFLARVARADHTLFWLSPLDSEPVRRTLQAAGSAVGAVGLLVTLTIVLSAMVVGLDSPLVLPVVATFTTVGYLAVGICLMSIRRSVGTLTRRVRDRHLAVLQDRIAGYGHRLGSLTPAENDELRHLVETYRSVRDAPTDPRASETFGHAARALLIPTLGFLLAVMSEVYAERLLDQLLP